MVQDLGHVGKTRPTDWDGAMDTKPKDDKPADLDLRWRFSQLLSSLNSARF